MISQLVSPTLNISSDSSFVVPGLQPTAYKVYAVIPATRVYHAAFVNSKQQSALNWTCSGLYGRLMFGKDQGSTEQAYWFRLLDDSGKTIWMFKIPEQSFEYRVDKPFFHVFRGSSREFGFLCFDDEEAASFAREVTGRTMFRPQSAQPVSAVATEPRSLRSRLTSSPLGRMISLPTANSFVHVAHVGRTQKIPSPAAKVEPENEGAWTLVAPDDFIEQHNIANKFMNTPKTAVPVPLEVQGQGKTLKPQRVRRKPSPNVPVS
ncbi:Wiskott-Aldrich syndrome 1 [Favolaschia claudopus]|uniref:Wiskott-Aldrich syndrome 1 n=1 Tax=Favolaschia claudopus TaxID=2862362 RepID=A0AAW0CTJ9_9AGAR